MKGTVIGLKKLAVRGALALGALLGLTSCPRVLQQEKVYGPPPASPDAPIKDSIQVRKLVYGPRPVFRRDTINVLEDVYGPPVEMHEDSAADGQTN